MMRRFPGLFVFVSMLLPSLLVAAEGQECRRFITNDTVEDISGRFGDALLWKVVLDDGTENYVFGTIHVSDPRVLDLPESVVDALDGSTTFAMEAVPELDDIFTLRQLMFFSDESRLSDMLDADLYSRAVEILRTYNMTRESITRMKPWAAYLTMNYPVNNGLPLDLVLLEMAHERGMSVSGLETLNEQLSALTGLDHEDQVRILLDTVCNYEQVLNGFEDMIGLYLEQDLKGLYAFSLRHSFADDRLYRRLYQKLLLDRNHLMVKRMQPLLRQGGVFVAIGALHLTGDEGVLALLEQQGYRIEPVY